MHVLFVSRSFPHHRAGGLEWHCHDVVAGLIAAGHRVSVVTTPLAREPALAPLETNGRVLIAGGAPATYDRLFFTQLSGAVRALGRDKPDVIHAQGFAGTALSFAGCAGVPLVTTVHGTLWSETDFAARMYPWRYKHRYAFAPVWRAFLKRRPNLVVDSQFTAEYLVGEGFRGEASVVPLGVDLDRYPAIDRDDARADLGIGRDEKLLFAVGRLEAVKGPETLVQAFRAIADNAPQARFVIAGEGTLAPWLRQFARNHPRIDFPGRIAPEKLASHYAAADLFLNADRGRPAFGLTNAEALLYGTPVLASDSGAHREVVREPADGRIVGADERWSDALNEAAAALPEAPEIRETRAAAARARFGRESMVKGLVAAYRRAIES